MGPAGVLATGGSERTILLQKFKSKLPSTPWQDFCTKPVWSELVEGAFFSAALGVCIFLYSWD